VSEHTEKKKQSEAAVPPWVGYNEEETMKTQILALSKVPLMPVIYCVCVGDLIKIKWALAVC